MKDEHAEPCAVARLGIFQHLSVADRIAERSDGPPADHQVNAFGFAGIVVIEQQLGLLGDHWLAVLVIAIIRPHRGADHLLGRVPYTFSAYKRTKSWPPPVTI